MKATNIYRGILTCFLLWAFSTQLIAQQWRKVNIPLESFEPSHVKEQLIGELPELAFFDLELVHLSQSPVGHHLTFKQKYLGLEVYQSEIRLHLDKNNLIYGLTSKTFALNNQLPNFRKPASNMLEQVEVKNLLTDASDHQEKYCWWVEDGKWKQAYQIYIYNNEGGIPVREVVLELNGMTPLLDEDAGTYFGGAGNHQGKKDTIGYGRVFLPDPCTRAELEYGMEFDDAKDSHSPIFDLLMDTVVLRDISFLEEDSLFALDGPYVKVVDRASFFEPIALSDNGDFFFNRNQSEFEDVMAYYHIDNFRRYVEDLGFGDLYNRPIEIDPHGLGDNDQSVFVANGGNSYILMGDGGVDDAEDADVIIHEYVHALSYDAAPGSNKGFERKGLDEGYADYFAAAYSYDLSSWNWFELFNWDGQNEFWEGRRAISLESYPPINGFGSIYEVGSLWASTLMNIRLDLGTRITDQLVLQSFYYSFRDMSLTDASALLLEADTALFDGIYTPVIRDRLCQRNLFSSPFCIAVSNEEPLESPPSIDIGPNPAQNHLSISWEGYKDINLYLINTLGQEVFHEKLDGYGARILPIPSSIRPGYYMLRIEQNGGGTLVQKLNIVGP